MGQKSLDFSINKCVPTQLPSHSKPAHKANHTSAKCPADRHDVEVNISQPQRRLSTEELSRWVQRLTKAKIMFRKQHDLRREVLVHNANLFAQTEIKFRQMERQKRWKEMKALFALESSSSPFAHTKMAAPLNKMADDAIEMAGARDVEMVRPDTPIPALGFKRSLCGCPSSNVCFCKVGEMENPSSKRPRSRVSDDFDDLKSLDCFLASLHCNSRQIG